MSNDDIEPGDIAGDRDAKEIGALRHGETIAVHIVDAGG